MGKRLILMGLIEPETDDLVQAFKDWYLGNHVEDTFNCPNIKSARCFKAVRGFLGDAPGEYLTVYEFEGEDAEEAERILAEYQADPAAYPPREPPNDSVKTLGAGWYAEVVAFED